MTNGGGGLAAWRFASRLARREVRRRPGRTVLVVVLVALPVLAMTVGSVMARTGSLDAGLGGWRDGTDIVVEQYGRRQTDISSIAPSEAEVDTVAIAEWVPIETTEGTTIDEVMLAGQLAGAGGGHPLAVDGGRAPGAGEIWLSTSLAGRLDVAVGERVELAHPNGAWTVSGIGRLDEDFDKRVAVFGELPSDQLRPAQVRQATLIDLPGDPSQGELNRVGRTLAAAAGEGRAPSFAQLSWSNRPDHDDGTVSATGLAWGWVAGAIALAAMGIIIAAAFATSARRQMVTIGLLSANGASQALTRRTLALQGFWTGVLGSATGIGIGLVGLFAARSTIERIVGHAIAPFQITAIDLGVIAVTGVMAATIAALIPARSATRVPVVAALAGRRPLGTVPARLVPIGLTCFAFGIFLLVVAASPTDGGNAAAAAAVIGGLLVLSGACCASPLAIDTMSRASAALGRSWRFAGRSLGRTRHRSAAVVTAIAVTGALACAGSSAALGADDESSGRYLPNDAILLLPSATYPTPIGKPPTIDFEALPDHPVDDELKGRIEAIVPGSEWHPMRMVTWDAAPFREKRGPRAADGGRAVSPDYPNIAVADEAVLDLYTLDDVDRAALESGDVLLTSPWSSVGPTEVGTAPDTITIATETGDLELPVSARGWVEEQLTRPDESIEFDGISGPFTFLITEQAARDAGLDVVTLGGIVRTDEPLTRRQQDALNRVVYDEDLALGSYYRDVPRPRQELPWSVAYESSSWEPPRLAVQAAIVGVALLLTLLVVAIGLSLAATESRDERDVLVAVGARPMTMRRMAGGKAVVITVTGVLLGIPTGLVPLAAVMRTLGEPFHVPWLALAGLVFVVPAIAGLAAWGVSSVAQRTRPVRMSTLAFE